MHGLIHLVFKNFVLETWGEDAWKTCLEKAKLAEGGLLGQIGHSDSVTMALFNVVCECQEIPSPDLLERFGQFFLKHVVEEGYITFLHTMGRSLSEIVSNINVLHNAVLREKMSCVFPQIEVTHISGDPEIDQSYVFRLCYGSTRYGLDAFLLGVLRGLAFILFYSTIDVEDTSTSEPADFTMMPVQSSWRVTVHRQDQGKGPDRVEKIRSECSSRGESNRRGSFFDFHTLMASMWSCVSCVDSGAAHGRPSGDGVSERGRSWPTELPDLGPEVRSIVLDKQENIDKILESYTLSEQKQSYDSLVKSLTGTDRLRLAAVLFRGICASHVAAGWTELDQRPDVVDFWDIQGHADSCYRTSKDWLGSEESMAKCRQTNGHIVFVSHCWNKPVGWAETMAKQTSFPQTKAAELCCYAKDACRNLYGDASTWGSIGFWIDKACIPQGDPDMMALCVNLLEEFIALSDGMIVLASWNYFSRLWCVYEWVCGLLIHSAMEIEILADPFIRDSTVDTYLLCIRNFSVAKCNCNNESDRQTLIDKVHAYYKSVADFERFFQCSVIVCFCRCIVKRRLMTQREHEVLKPWSDLSKACGFEELALLIRQLSKSLARFQEEARNSSNSGSSFDVQAAFSSKVDDWFSNNVAPLLFAEQEQATNHFGMTYIRNLRTLTDNAKHSSQTLNDWLDSTSGGQGVLLRSHRRALYSAAFIPETPQPSSSTLGGSMRPSSLQPLLSPNVSQEFRSPVDTALGDFMRSAALETSLLRR